jgi:GntR family transcriptional regulator, transcriptional repressor for pyruvate dehydrogenase complex
VGRRKLSLCGQSVRNGLGLFEALGAIVSEMDACETVDACVENDLAFHPMIVVASRNPVLASLLDSFSSRTSRARVWRGVTPAGAIEQTKADHRAIYDVIVHRRVDVAAGRATAHVSSVESLLEHALEEPAAA